MAEEFLKNWDVPDFAAVAATQPVSSSAASAESGAVAKAGSGKAVSCPKPSGAAVAAFVPAVCAAASKPAAVAATQLDDVLKQTIAMKELESMQLKRQLEDCQRVIEEQKQKIHESAQVSERLSKIEQTLFSKAPAVGAPARPAVHTFPSRI